MILCYMWLQSCRPIKSVKFSFVVYYMLSQCAPSFFQPRPKSPKVKPFFLITMMQNKLKSVKKPHLLSGFLLSYQLTSPSQSVNQGRLAASLALISY